MLKFLTSLDLQKNQITNFAIQNVTNSSIVPVLGEVIIDSDNILKYWDGSKWQSSGLNGLNIIPTTGTLDLANGITLDVNNTVTFNSTNGAIVYLNSGGNVAFKENKLNVFAATTSSELAGVISDETGTGYLVFNSAPTIVNPIIDNIAASAATMNADLWSEITTGSITIGSGLTTGAVNIATSGISTTSINIGHAQSTTTFLGNVALPNNGLTKLGQTSLYQGGAVNITFPTLAGTLARLEDIGNATLTLANGTVGASGTTISFGTNTGYSANGFTNTVYQIKAGPALTNLATVMANVATGFIKKTGIDTYSFDGNTYLTVESDTLETVTTRGNSSSKIITLTNTTPNIIGDESTGALIVAGGVGIAGNVSIGGNLNVDGTITYINSTEVDIGDSKVLLNSLITNASGNTDGGLAVKRFSSLDVRKDAEIIYNESIDRWQTTFGDAETTLVTATLANKGIAFLGDGSSTTFVVTHNFNTQDLTVAVRETASPYALVYTDVEFTNASALTVKFAKAPTTSQYKLTIIG